MTLRRGSRNSLLEKTFMAADNLFRGAVISALDKKYVDNYIICTTAKELWDALEAKFGVSDAGSELYLMEQLFDYKMVDSRSVNKHMRYKH